VIGSAGGQPAATLEWTASSSRTDEADVQRAPGNALLLESRFRRAGKGGGARASRPQASVFEPIEEW